MESEEAAGDGFIEVMCGKNVGYKCRNIARES